MPKSKVSRHLKTLRNASADIQKCCDKISEYEQAKKPREHNVKLYDVRPSVQTVLQSFIFNDLQKDRLFEENGFQVNDNTLIGANGKTILQVFEDGTMKASKNLLLGFLSKIYSKLKQSSEPVPIKFLCILFFNTLEPISSKLIMKNREKLFMKHCLEENDNKLLQFWLNHIKLNTPTDQALEELQKLVAERN